MCNLELTVSRYISTIQGRPLGFEDHSLDLEMPVILPEPFESESERSDQVFLPCSIAHFKWASAISKIKQTFYRLKQGSGLNTTIDETQMELQDQLICWLEQSPQMVEALPPSHRAQLKTKYKINYHFAVGLLHQPSQSCPHPSEWSLRICLESAKSRIRLSDALYRKNNLVLHWPSTHGIFLAGATYVYSIWASSEIRSEVSPAEVAADFRLCSSLLALGGEWWPVARKGKRSFEKLADATLNALMARGTVSDQGVVGSGSQNDIASGTGSSRHERLAPTADPASTSIEDYQWLDVEALLQPYLQNDIQFPDLFGSFDMAELETPESRFDSSVYFNTNMDS